MAFPLGTVLSAAPGIISGAAELIRVIRERKSGAKGQDTDRLAELENLVERQALLIEELAQNNSNMVLAVRNNRVVAALAIALALLALAIVIWR